jgi:hypothetical protein
VRKKWKWNGGGSSLARSCVPSARLASLPWRDLALQRCCLHARGSTRRDSRCPHARRFWTQQLLLLLQMARSGHAVLGTSVGSWPVTYWAKHPCPHEGEERRGTAHPGDFLGMGRFADLRHHPNSLIHQSHACMVHGCPVSPTPDFFFVQAARTHTKLRLTRRRHARVDVDPVLPATVVLEFELNYDSLIQNTRQIMTGAWHIVLATKTTNTNRKFRMYLETGQCRNHRMHHYSTLLVERV